MTIHTAGLAPLLPHILVGQPSADGGAAYTVICRGPAHEHGGALAIFISARELADMPRNRDVADQLARRAEAYHWFARFAPETANSFRVEVVLCPACRIADLTAIASAVGDIAAALGLPSETPPATVVAAARHMGGALGGRRLDAISYILETDVHIRHAIDERIARIERDARERGQSAAKAALADLAFLNPFAQRPTPEAPLLEREWRREILGEWAPAQPAGDWQCHVCGMVHPADHETAGCSHGLRCRRCVCNKCPRGGT